MKAEKIYFQSVKAALPSKFENKNQFIKDLENNIANYCKEHKDVTTETLQKVFGTPEEISESILSETLASEIISHKRQAKSRMIIFIILIILFILFMILGAFTYHKNQQKIYVEKITVLKEEKIDLSNQTVGFQTSDGAFLGSPKRTEAKKEILLKNAKDESLFTIEIIAEFYQPQVPFDSSQKEPTVHIDMQDDKYQVLVKEVKQEKTSVYLTIQIDNGKKSETKEFTFLMDADGKLH